MGNTFNLGAKNRWKKGLLEQDSNTGVAKKHLNAKTISPYLRHYEGQYISYDT
jgi:hypothetical protein